MFLGTLSNVQSPLHRRNRHLGPCVDRVWAGPGDGNTVQRREQNDGYWVRDLLGHTRLPQLDNTSRASLISRHCNLPRNPIFLGSQDRIDNTFHGVVSGLGSWVMAQSAQRLGGYWADTGKLCLRKVLSE